jgi:hypothetical protein
MLKSSTLVQNFVIFVLLFVNNFKIKTVCLQFSDRYARLKQLHREFQPGQVGCDSQDSLQSGLARLPCN